MVCMRYLQCYTCEQNDQFKTITHYLRRLFKKGNVINCNDCLSLDKMQRHSFLENIPHLANVIRLLFMPHLANVIRLLFMPHLANVILLLFMPHLANVIRLLFMPHLANVIRLLFLNDLKALDVHQDGNIR